MKRQIQQDIYAALTHLNYGPIQESLINVEEPKAAAFGEYTTNIALSLAPLLKQNPLEVAEKIAQQLKSKHYEAQTVAPGFINFLMNSEYFAEGVSQGLKGENVIPAHPEKVMIEYSQPNTHKEFHIGHLRNVFIGSTLVNVFRKMGDEVIAANYIGDTGTHIAKCLWGLVTLHPNEDWEQVADKAVFLGRVYSEATKKIEENPGLEEEYKALQKRFEEGDKELHALWRQTREWSLKDFEALYQELGVHFDVVFYESIEEAAGKLLLPELLKRGVVKESEGAIVADLEAYNLGVLVLVRKDGSALYGLKDLPLAKKKFEEFGIEKSIYVVDIRQSLYFKQLFKILELLGFLKPMVHYGYEFVALKGGESMSSRKGNIVSARELIQQIENQVKEQFPDSPSPKDIALGALRFSMLRHSAKSKIEFDIEESVRLDGATGPYVQYAHARIASIVAKAAEQGLSGEHLSVLPRDFHEKEKDLIREIKRFPELLQDIHKTYEVHKLTHYALHIADKFHSFYNECKVIDITNKELSEERLKLILAVKKVLGETLRLLGISAPEKM